MKNEREIKKQISDAYQELERIAKEEAPLMGSWRSQRRYIDALEWVLDK